MVRYIVKFIDRYVDRKSGSAGVLLCMMLASLILAVSLLCGALCLSGGKSALNRAVSLSAKSLMSEYDVHLYEDYGIFALITDEKSAAETILRYTDEMVNMKNESGKLDLFGLESIEAEVDIKGGSLMDLDNFEEQITREIKYKIIIGALGLPVNSANASDELTNSADVRSTGKQRLKRAEEDAARAEKEEAESKKEAENSDDDSADTEKNQRSAEAKNTIQMLKAMAEANIKGSGADDVQTKTLRNKALIEALPSVQAGLKDNWTNNILKGADILKNAFSGENGEFYKFEDLPHDLLKGAEVNEYILAYCKNRHKESGGKETFFENEAEYVLYGKKKDSDNYEAFKEKFLVLRTALNLIHIYSDAEKKEEVAALAAAAFPGPGAPAAQLVIATAWAASESAQDLKTLENGGKVPLIKSKESWQMSWQRLLEGGRLEDSEKESGQGLDYEDYLRIFLAGVSRETKLLRMMDIIQLNMKGRYFKDFSVKSCYTGFFVSASGRTRAIGPMIRSGGKTWIYVTSEHSY